MVKNVEMLRLGCRGPSDISQKKPTDSLSAPDLDYECYYLHLLQYIAIIVRFGSTGAHISVNG